MKEKYICRGQNCIFSKFWHCLLRFYLNSRLKSVDCIICMLVSLPYKIFMFNMYLCMYIYKYTNRNFIIGLTVVYKFREGSWFQIQTEIHDCLKSSLTASCKNLTIIVEMVQYQFQHHRKFKVSKLISTFHFFHS